jgi:hypothetical protein
LSIRIVAGFVEVIKTKEIWLRRLDLNQLNLQFQLTYITVRGQEHPWRRKNKTGAGALAWTERLPVRFEWLAAA